MTDLSSVLATAARLSSSAKVTPPDSARVDCPHECARPDSSIDRWARYASGRQQGTGIFIDRARDHIKVQLLGLARLIVHIKCQGIRIGIGQPLINGQAIALGL